MGWQRRRLLWRRVHAWIGWPLGLLLTLIGLSGGLLVFYPEIDTVLHPALHWQRSDGAVHSWQAVWRALQQAEPQRGTAWRIEIPPQGEGMVTARYLQPVERQGAFFAPLMVTLHPQTLQPLARRFWGDTLMTWIYDLHYTLLAGSAGRWVVGGLGLLAVVALISGLALWWPQGAQRRHGAWWLKPDASRVRRTWDQHRLIGLYGSGVMLVLVLTGVLLAWPTVCAWLLPGSVGQGGSGGPAPVSAPCDVVRQGVSLDTVLAQAAEHGRGTPRWVDTPGRGKAVFRVRVQQPGEPSEHFPGTYVWVEGCSGQVLAVHDPRQGDGVDHVLAWLHPLHNGEALGLTGRLIALAGGLWWAVMMWTGWRRHRDRLPGQRPRAAP
jgi:uncharacterized iron-regulated membrane protein